MPALDPDAPDLVGDPYGFYRTLRDEHPVARVDATGEYLVSRFADVHAITRDWRRFSSETSDDNHDHFASMDPPRHDDHRASVARLFTPRRIAGLEPQIRVMCRDLLAPLAARGRFDLASELAALLPSQVITRIVGVPHELREDYRLRALAIASATSTGTLMAAMRDLQAVTWDAVEGGYELPPGEILATLLDGVDPAVPEALTTREIVGLCTNLVLAGTDTATNLITTTAVLLHERPELRARLAAAPDLLPAAVEEVLRYDAPVQWLRRRAVEPVELHGVTIPAGALVRLYWASANRDEREIDRPDELDIDRDAQRHLAFGHGLHFCIGAALARAETRIAVEELLALDPGYAVDRDAVVRLPSTMFRGYEHVPVRVDAHAAT